MKYLVEIIVQYGEGVLNSEARAIQNMIGTLGYEDIEEFGSGKRFTYITNKEGEESAREEASELCEELLAFSVNEVYEIVSVEEVD